jgi:hypothetical protein
VSTPSASEQISQQPERSQSNMDSTLPSCFNTDALLLRLLFLVSPTCEICVSGAMSAADSVLWLPVLEGDTPQAAEQVQERLPTDDRLRHFWDHDLKLSQAFHRLLQLGQRPGRIASRGTSFSSMEQESCGPRSRRCQNFGCTSSFWTMCQNLMQPS